MNKTRIRLLSSAAIVPLVMGMVVGVGMLSAGITKNGDVARAQSNPCAAKKCGAANPCAAGKCAACGPCSPAASECVVPSVQAAARCNPCAAKKCGPCNPCKANACGAANPCAAKKCGPCNPCAAKKCGPCNPCKANACGPCGPCGPCGASKNAKITNAEAVKAYDCVKGALQAAYAKSGLAMAKIYSQYARFNTVPYVSDTHGGRLVNNYASRAARRTYRKYEKARQMPRGSKLAKDSFSINAAGAVVKGPLFLMEKKRRGWNKATNDWRYSMVMPDGSVFGATRGKGDAKVQFCADCHNAAAENDAMFFLPAEFRVK